MKGWDKIALLISVLAACGGDSGLKVDPSLDEFTLDPAVATEVENAAANGSGAEGSYTESMGTITIDLEDSSFGCGIEVGAFTFTVTFPDDNTMLWTNDGDPITWTRLDEGGTGMVGVWKTTDPDLYLILTSGGDAQIFGEGEACDEREQNADGCYEVTLSGADIAVDGMLSDWDGVGTNATLTDPAGDFTGMDGGADLASLKVEFAMGSIYVLQSLHNPLSTDFTGASGKEYRLTLRGDNGLSLGARAVYNAGKMSWETVGVSSEITVAGAGNALEWRADVSSFEGQGFQTVDLVLLESRDCSQGGCVNLDDMDCAWFVVPQ